MIKILALDQASLTTGFAIFEDGNLIDYGKFTFNDPDIAVRLVKIRNKVKALIEENDINFVAFEDIQLQNNVVNNVATFKVLSEVYGVILELIQEKELPYIIVLAGTWKSGLKIKGANRQEQKKNAQNFVLETFNIKATQDTCDAICIGLYASKHQKQNTGFDWS